VVMLEQTVEDEQSFTIRKSFNVNENVSLKGEETQIGDTVLNKGQQINPGAIAVLATYGYTQVKVFDKPSIGVIATGSELLEVGDDLEP
ncbi:molybdopterin molybdenumtransferase MoeA, partial [Staphylococcus caprae]